jgi:hypothetical protein
VSSNYPTVKNNDHICEFQETETETDVIFEQPIKDVKCRFCDYEITTNPDHLPIDECPGCGEKFEEPF